MAHVLPAHKGEIRAADSCRAPGKLIQSGRLDERGIMLGKLVLVGLTALLAAAFATAGASGRLTGLEFNASGIETGVPTGDTSPFAGAAIGPTGLAVWQASVPHGSLDVCGVTPISGSASVPAGAFSLAGTRGVRLSGGFTGGSVTAPADFCSSGVPCKNEPFAIDAHLTVNGMDAEFTGTLTHFNAMLPGGCVTYFATISGHLSVG
jgi:hypothetical protein